MPVSVPYTFTVSTNIEAAKLKSNNETVRSYLNGSIVASDLDDDIVTDQHLAKGQYISAHGAMHWFHSGEVIGASKGGQAWERTYFTGQGKQIEDYTTVTQAVPVGGTGASLVLEHDAIVFIHGYFQVVIPEGSLNGNTVGKDHELYYVINSPLPSSYALGFTEGATASTNSGAVQGETPNNRRSYPIQYMDNLTAGVHDLYLQVNLDEQQGYISSYAFYIEAFYK